MLSLGHKLAPGYGALGKAMWVVILKLKYGPWKAERVLRVKRLVFLYSQIYM